MEWNEECQKSFDSLKRGLLNIESLWLADLSLPTFIYTDAWEKAIGAVCAQMHNNKEVPIAFASRVMNSTERRYSTIDRECLAIIWATRKFRHFLYGTHFTIDTE